MVRASVAILVIIGGNSIGAQIDAEMQARRAVRENRVAANAVSHVGRTQGQAVSAIEGDGIAIARVYTANNIEACSTAAQGQAAAAIAEGADAVGFGPNKVTPDGVGNVRDRDAVAAVTGNEVDNIGRAPTDDVVIAG